MLSSHCRVPLQDNSSDCGLYLLQYVETFLEVRKAQRRHPSFPIGPSNAEVASRLLLSQDPVVHFDLPLRLERWFPRQLVRRKRNEIRDLVLNLHRRQSWDAGT